MKFENSGKSCIPREHAFDTLTLPCAGAILPVDGGCVLTSTHCVASSEAQGCSSQQQVLSSSKIITVLLPQISSWTFGRD